MVCFYFPILNLIFTFLYYVVISILEQKTERSGQKKQVHVTLLDYVFWPRVAELLRGPFKTCLEFPINERLIHPISH